MISLEVWWPLDDQVEAGAQCPLCHLERNVSWLFSAFFVWPSLPFASHSTRIVIIGLMATSSYLAQDGNHDKWLIRLNSCY